MRWSRSDSEITAFRPGAPRTLSPTGQQKVPAIIAKMPVVWAPARLSVQQRGIRLPRGFPSHG